ALAGGSFDVVHGFEPGLPSLSYLALRDTQALAVASFFSPERLAYPPRPPPRARLLGRVDAPIAAGPGGAAAAARRLPRDYAVVSPGVDTELFRPGAKRRLAVLESRPGERALARATIRMLLELPGWELVLLRERPFGGRPYVPRALRTSVHVRTVRDAA